MITVRSVVLYLRLHIVLYDPNILRAVLWMIIVNGLLWYSLTTILAFDAVYTSAAKSFTAVYVVAEKVQITLVCVQEFMILLPISLKQFDSLKWYRMGILEIVMWHLFSINVVIVLMDISLLTLRYKDQRKDS